METEMSSAIPVDIYGEEGEMQSIRFNTKSGEHIIDAVWDENDEQTPENRIAFRKWAYSVIRDKGYQVNV